MYKVIRSGRIYLVKNIIRPDVFIKAFRTRKEAQLWVDNHNK